MDVIRRELEGGRVLFRCYCDTCGPRSIYDQIGTPAPTRSAFHTIETAEQAARDWADHHTCKKENHR